MKKVQKALALGLGLCLAFGITGALVACGDDDKGGNQPKVGDKSVYYAVGNFSDQNLPQAVDWGEQHAEKASDVDDSVSFKVTATKNVYELSNINLYKDDMFQICIAGQAWSGQMGYKTFKTYFDEDENERFKAHDSFPVDDIQVVVSGTYTFRLDMSDSLKPTISYEYVGEAPKLPNPVKGITLNKTGIGLELPEEGGDPVTFQIEPTLNPVDADEKDDIKYKSEDPSIATVSATGLVTAVAPGNTKITVTCGDKTAEMSVVVVAHGDAVYAESIELDYEEVTLYAGTPVTLNATINPDYAFDKTIDWTSSDDKVVTVEDGKLTAVSVGTATITATVGVGDKAKTAECVVTVPEGYYLIGNLNEALEAGNWTNYKGDNGVDFSAIKSNIVLTQDAENENKYVLGSVALLRGNSFKLSPLSGLDSSWTNAISFANVSNEAGKFSDGGGGNLKCLDSAEYKLVVEFVADEDSETPGAKKAVLSYEIVKDIEDVTYDSYTVTVWGSGNGWKTAYEGATKTVTADNKYVYEVELELAVDEIFQVRQDFGGSEPNYIGKGQGVNGANDANDLFNNESNNYKCKEAGTYKFTITMNEYGECEKVEVVKVDAAE